MCDNEKVWVICCTSPSDGWAVVDDSSLHCPLEADLLHYRQPGHRKGFPLRNDGNNNYPFIPKRNDQNPLV